MYMPLYGQSAYEEFRFQRVWLKQTLTSKGWNSQAHRDFLGISLESLTRAMLVGTMLVGSLGVYRIILYHSILY